MTIPLTTTSKRPKIIDAFAIFSLVLFSIYPSRATMLIAYQQLIRDAATKFPRMAWCVYDIEFWPRASHDLSINWGNSTSNYI